MAPKFVFFFLLCLHATHGATLLEKSYEYLMSWGKSLAPNFLELVDCVSDDDVWGCTRLKAGKMLDGWSEDVDQQRRLWQESADAEVQASGRSYVEKPSKIGMEIETSVNSLTELLQSSLARAFEARKHGGIHSVTVTTNDKMKKKKKKKPVHVHHAPAPTMAPKVEEKEQRGKKKKKRKAILKLLLLGAVLKAKIGTLLQILSFKLQVKFLLIALVGLLINIARFWIDVKKTHAQPQKVIYYEHAQHQHHYDHEEEPGWGGPWSRSIDPEEAAGESEIMIDNSPYRVQEGYNRARMMRAQYRK